MPDNPVPTSPSGAGSHPSLRGGELVELFDRLIDGVITPEEHQKLEGVLLNSHDARTEYLAYIDHHVGLSRLNSAQEEETLAGLTQRAETIVQQSKRHRSQVVAAIILSAVALSLVAAFSLRAGRVERHAPVGEAPVAALPVDTGRASSVPAVTANASDRVPEFSARLKQVANAELLGELLPPLESHLKNEHQYVLCRGMLELEFPAGALVVLEGPAIFEINNSEKLSIGVGRCSVYAPPGAEGFQVVTPSCKVTDLGTRFFVTVDEGGNSDLHVIEGAAELRPSTQPEASLTLFHGDAQRVGEISGLAPIDFDSRHYRNRLPDRVVSYQAEQVGQGGAVRNLQRVTVQRNGVTHDYPVDDLIGIDVVSFLAGRTRNCLAWDGEFPDDPAVSLTGDVALNTGLFNFGGRWDSRDEQQRVDGAPRRGMGIRFRQPVINGPGPDVVLFELQSVVYPLEGDPFWVSPLTPESGRHSHHVTRFDITMSSAEALPVAPYKLITFLGRYPLSLEQMDRRHHVIRRTESVTLPYKALAVGIDLSDLGYPPGAEVEGLFFESDESHDHMVDPVFIAGLPPVE
ncbi:hypothetical protein [Planctomicrobium sp. SH664]|uniref:hypothetical protein n=1 Tax=Planctomicrobium sp. SH664 TaxID=3448125 RepID=UPI003F5BC391